MKTTKNFSYVTTFVQNNTVTGNAPSYKCISAAIKSAKEQMIADGLINDGDYSVISISPEDGGMMTPIFTMFSDGRCFIQKCGDDNVRPSFSAPAKKAKAKKDHKDEEGTPATEEIKWDLDSLRGATKLNVICFDDSDEKGNVKICFDPLLESGETRYSIAYVDRLDGNVIDYLWTKDKSKVRTFVSIPKTGYNWNQK